ncbi:MAG: type II toxin-antitoxin system HicB family antitoxin [Bacillota bacterium]|nr:type II toxin-antitoxin system HicB family antitoxin [Bacillota bacterium]
MSYKDFAGSINFSAEDRTFFGKIEFINDSITFEGSNVEELEAAFHEAVDDYLELCKLNGKEPERAFKGTFNVRIEPELHRTVAREALFEGVSLNQFVEDAIREKVSKDNKNRMEHA